MKAGQIVWFRSDTLQFGAGNVLTSWTDKGPNGYNATPHGGPLIIPNALNGKPAIRFASASSQYCSYAGTTQLLDPASPFSLVIVTKAPAVLGTDVFQSMFTACSGAMAWQGWGITTTAGYPPLFWGAGDGVGGTAVGIAGFDYSSAVYALVCNYTGGGTFSDPTKFSALKNNVAQSLSAGAGSNSARNQSMIAAWDVVGGSPLYYDGDYYEIILYNSVLSPTEEGQLHSYLNFEWGNSIG